MTPTRAGRPGYSLLEVVMALAILGLLVVGFVHSLRDSSRSSTYEARRTVALLLLRNTVAALEAGGPTAALARPDTARVNDAGDADPRGRYRIDLERAVTCDGGVETYDNARASAAIPSTCVGARPILAVTVRVRFAKPGAADPVAGTVSAATRLGGWTRAATEALP